MSRLAHTTLGAQGFEKEKQELGAAIQHEIQEAKRIQEQTGCTWGEALTAAYRKGRQDQ